MMRSEFIERTGFEPTMEEYEQIEREYMGCDIDKDAFCKQWKKQGGIERLSRMRVRRIEELEREVQTAEKERLALIDRFSSREKELLERIASLEGDLKAERQETAKYRQMHGETEEQLTDIKCSLRSLFRYVKEDLQ